MLAEETYNGTSASLSAVDGWAADGLRARWDGTQGWDFVYDPQGNVVARQNPSNYGADGAAHDLAFYEGYGAMRQTVKVFGGASIAAPDPVGFGGQYGYYTDTETGLLLLGHRYYDPGTGKFLNRDPIGYQGGANLYAFCGGNPVNESDPSGYAGGVVIDRPVPVPTEPGQERVTEQLGKGIYRFLFRQSGRAILINPVTLSVGLFFASTKTVADDSTGPGSPYYAQHHFWKRKILFDGKTVYQSDNQFQFTPSNVALMKKGKAPYGSDGKPIVLHHMLQTDDGPIAEVTMTFHQKNFGVLHINMPTQQFPSGINRDTFAEWKAKYWMQRAQGH